MKIAVFGATGMAGAAIVAEALSRGHTVSAVARTPDRLPPHGRLSLHSVDITGPDDLDALLTDCDTAVLTVRFPPDDGDALAPVTTRFLDATARTGTRVIVVGGAAPLRSPRDPDRLVADDPDYVPVEWRAAAQASLEQFRACQQHPHRRWVYLSPPATFEPGDRTGSYRRGTTQLLTDADGTSRISAADFAIAVLDEVEAPGDDQHFTVAQVASDEPARGGLAVR